MTTNSIPILRILAILLTITGLSSELKAHSPSDLVIDFVEAEEGLELTMQTTPQTIMDLIGHLHPDLKGQPLNMHQYTMDIVSYFNNELDLNINGVDQQFVAVDYNFNQHDAFIRFELSSAIRYVEGFNLEVNVLKFYNQPQYFVTIPYLGTQRQYLLSASQNTCSEASDFAVARASFFGTDRLAIVALLVLCIGGMIAVIKCKIIRL